MCIWTCKRPALAWLQGQPSARPQSQTTKTVTHCQRVCCFCSCSALLCTMSGKDSGKQWLPCQKRPADPHAAQRIPLASNRHDIGTWWHRITQQNSCLQCAEAGQDLQANLLDSSTVCWILCSSPYLCYSVQLNS